MFVEKKKDKEIKENFSLSSGISRIIFYIIAIFGFYMWYSFHYLVENPDRNFLTILYPLFFNYFYIIFNFIFDFTRSLKIIKNVGTLQLNNKI
jgi:hypothetical protein